MSTYQFDSGHSYPLGATYDGEGVNFAIFSANAQKVELCLFDSVTGEETDRITLPEFTDDIWHLYVKGLPVGSHYGYRVYGPYAPHDGHRFNSNKLLLDPYAKTLVGDFIRSDLHYGFDVESHHQDLTLDNRDNAAFMPKCVVVEPLDRCSSHPKIRRRDTLLYELHVKGFTQLNPDVPIELRGTFAGLANESVCQYLKDLGVTSIELLPVQQFINEAFIENKGLSNYWGYNSIAFFVPQASYCHSGDVAEFKAMVDVFHQAGIEVILDVVYNHTAEGNELGPTLSFKGIDNASYYRLDNNDKRYYENYSGCGNTLNIHHPRVLQMVTDSLRYWVEVMGVDGFRFDLAPVLGRAEPHFSANNHFFSAVRQDPILSTVKLIAEPWDIGHGGYQLGCFPNSWLEWNDRFRDTCRRFWRGDDGQIPEFARRLHGSSDIFEKPGRRPASSVNFLTSHDGFSLHDLVTYQERHNLANGEDNRDGHSGNYSANFGVEGPTDDVKINQLRERQKRNLLTTLFISQGTPMLLAGDEVGNSQQGNNNAYCQDNEISWIDWQKTGASDELEFTKCLIKLRQEHPLLNRTHYQHGNEVSAETNLPDISWLNFRGTSMQENDWHDTRLKCFAMLIADTEADNNEFVGHEHEHVDDALLIIFNAHDHLVNYQLPVLSGMWKKLIDTADESLMLQRNTPEPLLQLNVAAHSCIVMSYIHQNINK